MKCDDVLHFSFFPGVEEEMMMMVVVVEGKIFLMLKTKMIKLKDDANVKEELKIEAENDDDDNSNNNNNDIDDDDDNDSGCLTDKDVQIKPERKVMMIFKWERCSN
ncbi:hypothetical protein LOAG_14253 [Loa loa]|uniref:Uncharacterized protein n=1 Tax=Loa loa TaxID=7209 RepID=A0A1S0TII9_LOALO|nr:hypothetical protein LOAG_14253 [Loa loa]EFO14268.1 hypothetical protein LOAG_14253 [Loa loa]